MLATRMKETLSGITVEPAIFCYFLAVYFLFSVFLTVRAITDMEDRLDPVSQVDRLGASFLRLRDLLFRLSGLASNIALSSSTEREK